MEQVVGLYASQPFWWWAGLAALVLGIEVLTGTGWLLWASAAAGVTAVVVALAHTDLPVTLLIFAVLTMVSTLAVRRYRPRSASAPGADINDNVARLVGEVGQSVQVFAGGAGRVSIDGKEWAALLEDGGVLAAGERVRVTGVEGARLKVRPA